MRCKHCGKELKYDINNDTYAIYNGDIYCNTDCMLFDVDYGSVDVSSFNKEDWDSSINWNGNNENEMSIKDAMKILIQHNKRHADKINSHIKRRKLNNIGWRIHKLKCRTVFRRIHFPDFHESGT